MPTYGQRPEDVISDSRGNALKNVEVRLYHSEADATTGDSVVGTALSDERGRWSFEAAAGELWARLPDGTVWQVSDPGNLEDYLNITSGDERYYTKAQVDAAVAAEVASRVGGDASKSDIGHNHNELYYTEAEVDDLIASVENGGLPTGGSAGQALVKASGTDFDVEWGDAPGTSDSRVFDVMDYGGAVDGTTDDTAAWQAAIDAAAAAGGGVVTSSKNGVSVIGGALQDTGGANAQLTLPSLDAPDAEQVSIVIAGLTPPPAVQSVIGSTPTPDNHLVLKSTLASGTGAVIGAIGPVGTFSNFTCLDLRMENLTVRTVANPTISGLDLRHVACVDLDRIVVDAGSYHIGGISQPSTSTSYAIRLPKNGNGAHVRLGQVDVVGFYTGYEVGEHCTGQMVTAWGCRVAIEFDATDHASVFTRFMGVHCTVNVKFTGAHAVDFGQLNVEHADGTGGWRQTTYDIDDSSNYGKGLVRWWAVLANTGAHNSFTRNGATGISAVRLGSGIAAAADINDSTSTGRSVLTAANAAAARTAIGAGTGNGDVTGSGITVVWTGSQASYDAIGSKSSTTLYVIV